VLSSEKVSKQKYPLSVVEAGERRTEEVEQAVPWTVQGKWRPHSALNWHLLAIAGDLALLGSLLVLQLLLFAQPVLFGAWYKPDVWHPKLILACLAFVSWSVATKVTQAQEQGNLYGRLTSPLCALFALGLALFLLTILAYPFLVNEMAYLKGLLFYLSVAAPALCAWRVVLATIINLPRFRPRAVIIGTDASAESVASELRRAKRYSAHVLGYISVASEAEQARKDGLPVLGDRHVLRGLVQQGQVDMIIMAIDYKANQTLFQQVIELAHSGVSVVPMATAYERISGKISVQHIGDQWYVAFPSQVTASPFYLLWRRTLDIGFGLLGGAALILLLPILVPCIFLESPGPIFYRQERVGQNGRKFVIYKFRSMHTSSEQGGQAQWASTNDARVTRVGRFMRATHLDELPQVWNILRGEMSLIGPRPEREEFVSLLEQSLPFYRCRLNVKPGLTGWAQVKYGYASSNQDALEKLQYDLYYIKHQSFMLDVFIILSTVVEVLLRRGT
jgi:exopolysaccharide biosynthesis polyprenyl glycosylphosphotransferase